MHLPNTSRRALTVAALTLGGLAIATTLLTAQAPKTAPAPVKVGTTVAAAALEALLPAPADWLKLRSGSNHIELEPGCDYAFAEGVFMNEAMKVRITVADTGLHAESLGIFASMVVTFPDGYEGKIPPSTTVTRMTFKDAPAAARWDAQQGEGEFVVLVGGRFVAKAEGTVDKIDTLKAMVGQIDLKRLGELK
jgi:hypothetical protein